MVSDLRLPRAMSQAYTYSEDNNSLSSNTGCPWGVLRGLMKSVFAEMHFVGISFRIC